VWKQVKGQIVLSPVFRFVTVNGRSLTIEYPFIKHIPIVTVTSGSHVSGCAMIFGTGSKQIPLFFSVCACPFPLEARNLRL
jgi:hypothetical protein